jgi:hypothetical protein
MGRSTLAAGAGFVDPSFMRHPELVLPICTAIAVSLARLRWIVWSRWVCGRCSRPNRHCECPPSWKKLLF